MSFLMRMEPRIGKESLIASGCVARIRFCARAYGTLRKQPFSRYQDILLTVYSGGPENYVFDKLHTDNSDI